MNLGKRTRRALIPLASTIVLLSTISGWALNRYVIDHVKISDVAAYEAQVAASSAGSMDPRYPHKRSLGGQHSQHTGRRPGYHPWVSCGANPTNPTDPADPADPATTAPDSKKASAPPSISVRKVVTGSGSDMVT